MKRHAMLWDVSATHPDRDVVLVGERLAAVRWLLSRRPACRKAERVAGTAGLWGLSGKRVHVVLLPGYRRLRRSGLLRVGVWTLKLRGATVERV